MDAFARNEALLLLHMLHMLLHMLHMLLHMLHMLLHMLTYEVLHTGRRLMEAATTTGWSLRRFRERVLRAGGRVLVHARRATRVLRAGGRVLVHARRATRVVAETAARYGAMLWPRLDRLAWTGT